jgi:hypothetical protein
MAWPGIIMNHETGRKREERGRGEQREGKKEGKRE